MSPDLDKAASALLAETAILRISEEDQRQFAKAILHPPAPNAALLCWPMPPPNSRSAAGRVCTCGRRSASQYTIEIVQAATKLEYASECKIRESNKTSYRFAHWPIWIAVFFLAPGPLIFDLFAHGLDVRMGIWLALVVIGTGLAGVRGQLPGVEAKPYILRFTEDKPNPIYRRVCYTFAWSAVITFAVLNAAGLLIAVVSSQWYLLQLYRYAYFPIAIAVWVLGTLAQLPRVKRSTKGEGHERRYFYGSVWAVIIAQPILGLLWKVLPHTRTADGLKLVIFMATLGFVGWLARMGVLPRTRAIVPGELAVSD